MGEPTRSILGRSLEKSGLSSVLPSQQTWCTLMFHGGATAFAKSPKKLINSLLVFHCRVQVLNKSVIYMGFMMKKTRNWSQLIVGWGDINQQKKKRDGPTLLQMSSFGCRAEESQTFSLDLGERHPLTKTMFESTANLLWLGSHLEQGPLPSFTLRLGRHRCLTPQPFYRCCCISIPAGRPKFELGS